MESAKDEDKITKWRDVIGPVFQSIWPLDIELQTSASTFKLVQLLRASGRAFPEAADIIIPFIRPDEPRHNTTIHSLARADETLFSSGPEKMLGLVAAVVGDASQRNTYGLDEVLERIRKHAPQLANTKKFQKLLTLGSQI